MSISSNVKIEALEHRVANLEQLVKILTEKLNQQPEASRTITLPEKRRA